MTVVEVVEVVEEVVVTSDGEWCLADTGLAAAELPPPGQRPSCLPPPSLPPSLPASLPASQQVQKVRSSECAGGLED